MVKFSFELLSPFFFNSTAKILETAAFCHIVHTKYYEYAICN